MEIVKIQKDYFQSKSNKNDGRSSVEEAA